MDNTEEDVVVRGRSKRILAIDLIRGFFLLVIMVDHIELYPSIWDFFTGKGRLWVSAAEGFFFLSGLLIGMIYKRRLHLGFRFIFKKMWTRALELYVVGTLLTIVFVAWEVFTHHPAIKDALPVPFPWGHYIWQALTLRFTYGWADFLVHFAVLMFIAPFIFYLLAKRKLWLALMAMITMWLFRGEHFNLAWQIIFNSGIIIGFYWQEIKNSYRKLTAKRKVVLKRSVATIALVTFAASYATVFALSLLFHLWGTGHLPHWLQHVAYDWGNWNYDIWLYADKWKMGWLRIILFFFWFVVLYWIFRRYESQIGRSTKGLLELLGRNSLFVYVAESFIVFAFKMYVIPTQTGFIKNFLITGLALVLLIAVTIAYKRIENWLIAGGFSKIKLSLSQAFGR